LSVRSRKSARRDAPALASTVEALVTLAHRRLKRASLAFGHGSNNAWDEAVYLVLHALKLPLDELTGVLQRPVPATKASRVLELITERVERAVPAAYLTHEAWLGKFKFYVDERAIVPRSFIAELLTARLRPWLKTRQPIERVLDLCTGSGCLAIIAAHTFPRAQIDAVDISTDALAVAHRNVTDYRTEQRIRLIVSDLFAALPNDRYDLIIANPPYVRAATMARLPQEYKSEPQIALNGGPDGFQVIRRILECAAAHLAPEGWLVVEIGHNRPRLEREYPQLPFLWPVTSGGDDCVFMLNRDGLLHAVQPAPRRRPKTVNRAFHRR
jgi:ribosomal protein L3 glutamine methyltransferase